MINQSEDRLLSVSEVLRILDIPRHRLTYLFESRRLRTEDFLKLDNGQRLYRRGDIAKIKEVIFQVENK